MCARLSQRTKAFWALQGRFSATQHGKLSGSQDVEPGGSVVVVAQSKLPQTPGNLFMERPYGIRLHENLLHNARLETLWSKTTWSDAAFNHRCIVPVDSFFERDADGNWHEFSSEHALNLAAIGVADQGVRRIVVVTTASLPVVAEVHHRQPLLLSDRAAQAWLDNSRSPILERDFDPDLRCVVSV